MSSISKIYELVNQDGLTIEQAIEQVVPGADVAQWENILKRYTPHKKPSKKSSSRRTHRSTKTWRASSVLSRPNALAQQDSRAQATAELVTRANDNPPEELPTQSIEFLIRDGVHPYNDPEDEFYWVVIVDGDEVAWAETRQQAERSYEELTTPDLEPRSILVTCGNQLHVLEV